MERSDPKLQQTDWSPYRVYVKSRVMKMIYATILALSVIFAGLAADADEPALSSRQATRQWKIGVGSAAADQLNVHRTGILYSVGVAWAVQENFDLDVTLRNANFEKAGESGAQFSELLLGTNYYLRSSYLNLTPNAAFLSLAVGRAWASASTAGPSVVSDDQVSGWSARLGLGYKFFKTSTVNFGLELNYSKLLAESSRSKSSPGLTSAALALYY